MRLEKHESTLYHQLIQILTCPQSKGNTGSWFFASSNSNGSIKRVTERLQYPIWLPNENLKGKQGFDLKGASILNLTTRKAVGFKGIKANIQR